MMKPKKRSRIKTAISQNIITLCMIAIIGLVVSSAFAYILFIEEEKKIAFQKLVVLEKDIENYIHDVEDLVGVIYEIEGFYNASNFVDPDEFQQFTSSIKSSKFNEYHYVWIAADDLKPFQASYIYPNKGLNLSEFINENFRQKIENLPQQIQENEKTIDEIILSDIRVINGMPHMILARPVKKIKEEQTRVIGVLITIANLVSSDSFALFENDRINIKILKDTYGTSGVNENIFMASSDFIRTTSNLIQTKRDLNLEGNRWIISAEADANLGHLNDYIYAILTFVVGILMTAFLIVYMILVAEKHAISEGLLRELEGTSKTQQTEFPHALLTFFLVISLAGVGWLSYEIFNQNKLFNKDIETISTLKKLTEKLALYDEILTNSAVLSAVRGDLEYWPRYNETEPKLITVLRDAEKLAPIASRKLNTDVLKYAHEALITLEFEAFDQIALGNNKKAKELLLSDEYKKQKQLYANGLKNFQETLENQIQTNRNDLGTHLIIDVVISVFLVLIILASWFVLYNLLKRWGTTLIHLKEQAQEESEEKETAQKKAEKASHAKSEFLANMSHELRTPLNSIIGMTQLLEENSMDEDMRFMFNTIKSSSSSLLDIVNDILDLSKIEAGEIQLEYLGFDITQRIYDTVRSLEQLASKKGLLLKLNMDSEPVLVLGDPLRYARILINIISNAIRYTEQGQIEVRIILKDSFGDQKNIRCEVQDTGIGISEERVNKIFDKFTQADSSISRKYGGTGLGLTITKELVELMDGEIGVESKMGQGSTFWFEVPFEVVSEIVQNKKEKKSVAEQNQPSIWIAKPVNQVRILIAEDHAMNQVFVKKLLSNLGIENFEIAENGQIAFDTFKNKDFDLVLMDCHMPEMNGYEATESIREYEKNEDKEPTAIVAMTANAMPKDEEKCLAIGMNAYISKPIDIKVFKDVLSPWIIFEEEKKKEAPELNEPANDRAEIEPSSPIAEADHSVQDPPINLDNLISNSGGDEEFVSEMIGIFVDQANRQINELTEQIKDGENEDWVEIAHALKGTAGGIGAEKMRTLCATAQDMEDVTAEEREQILKQIAQQYKIVLDHLVKEDLYKAA